MAEQISLVSIAVGMLALSLIGAPITMADWNEQVGFSVERIEESQIDAETPILQYESLSTSAQNAIRRAIESPDGDYTIYGREDWPDEFFYSDYSTPGQGLYAVIYEGQYYKLYTYSSAGFLFLYYVYEIPFVAYGLALGWVAYGVSHGERSPHIALLAAVPGIAFHLLGPELDFPVLTPMQFVGLGVVATFALVVGLIGERYRRR